LAIPAALAEIPPNPKIAAIIAMIKNVIDHLSIAFHLRLINNTISRLI
jgi:capsular polysaccharide biosynthesis protein